MVQLILDYMQQGKGFRGDVMSKVFQVNVLAGRGLTRQPSPPREADFEVVIGERGEEGYGGAEAANPEAPAETRPLREVCLLRTPCPCPLSMSPYRSLSFPFLFPFHDFLHSVFLA